MPVHGRTHKIPLSRRVTPAADWDAFLAQIADTSRTYVKAPQGIFDVGAGLQIYRSNLFLDMRGCTLTVTDPTYQPVIISSTIAVTEYQATGTILADSDSLTIVDGTFAASVQVGDYHLIRAGVQWFDPQEPLYSVIRRVASKVGSVVTYDDPFGKVVTIYPDEDALRAVTEYDDRVGPWGTYSTTFFRRGLGTDHGIRVISSLTTDVTLKDLTLKYDGDEIMYGAWGILIGASRRVRLEQASVINPHGSAVHWYFANDSVIDGLSISGTGRGNPFGGASPKTSCAVAVSAWSSAGCTAKRVNLDAEDVELFNFESGCTAMRFEGCRINATFDAEFNINPQLGAYGPGDVVIDDLRVNVTDATNSRLFPSYLIETEISNLKIETAAMPDTFLWEGKGDFTEGLIWGSNTFSAPEIVVTEFTAMPGNVAIPYPAGIVMECSWTIESRTGFASWSIGGDPFTANPGATTFAKTDAQNGIAVNVTYSQYKAAMAAHRIYRDAGSGNAPVVMTCKVMREVVA